MTAAPLSPSCLRSTDQHSYTTYYSPATALLTWEHVESLQHRVKLPFVAFTMRSCTLWTLAATLLASTAVANTQKAIFVAPFDIPEAESLSHALPNLDLASLSPGTPAIRVPVDVAFPSEERPNGLDSWVMLSGLNPGQRYEVRICWATVVSEMSTDGLFLIHH